MATSARQLICAMSTMAVAQCLLESAVLAILEGSSAALVHLASLVMVCSFLFVISYDQITNICFIFRNYLLST